MATEKTPANAANLSVEERLKTLYELQTILSEIDRIKIIRGELPKEVKDLEDTLEGLHVRIDKFKEDINELNRRCATEEAKIEDANRLIAQYEQQMHDVRNNREFDLLSKELEFQRLEIELAEKHLHDFGNMIEGKNMEIEQAMNAIDDQEHILEEKRQELDEIVSETRAEEENLCQKALSLEPRIDARTLAAFKRIRKNTRNGLGIVYIQRNACGGCFNRIPPQRQAEIKMRKKVIVCEYCGRIMIDPELAGVQVETPAPAEAAAPKRRSSRKKAAPTADEA